MAAKPLIAITDYGANEPDWAILKYRILQSNPNIPILEISHNLPVNDIGLASYFIKKSILLTGIGNIYLAAVHNTYSQIPQYIILEKEGNYFIGPNNGIFTLCFEDIDPSSVYQLTMPEGANSSKDIYAHAISCINHNLSFEDFTRPLDHLEVRLMFRPVISQDTIRATIIYIDHFGNAVTNLTKESFERARKGRRFELHHSPDDPVYQIIDHYGQVNFGETGCIFNAANHLELGVNQGNASTQLNLFKNETIQIDFFDL
jgi:hypothetical protein